MEPCLQKQGLHWQDVQPLLELVDSPVKLQEAISDPDAFLEELLQCGQFHESGSHIARKLLLFNLKPKIELWLRPKGLTWEDVQPVLELIDLQELKRDPAAFFEKLVESNEPAL